MIQNCCFSRIVQSDNNDFGDWFFSKPEGSDSIFQNSIGDASLEDLSSNMTFFWLFFHGEMFYSSMCDQMCTLC